MASGKDLRRRIASVKSTQQITKAMKMVAAARLRRAQEAIVGARPFAAGIQNVVRGLVGDESIRDSHPLLARRAVKKVAVVLLTSDRGLCGSFNASLIKRAEQMFRDDGKNYEKFSFHTVGKKGYDFLNARKLPIERNYQDFFRNLKYAKVAALADELTESFLNGEVDEIRLVYAEFKSAISQIVTQETLLPVSLPTTESSKTVQAQSDFIFEPGPEQILREILPRYIKVRLYKAILESQASEYGARMAAMDNATKNAGEMIKKLTLEYNKVRQGAITKELLEIVSGAEALK